MGRFSLPLRHFMVAGMSVALVGCGSAKMSMRSVLPAIGRSYTLTVTAPVSSTQVTLITGESAQLSASNGTGVYTWSDVGAFVNTVTGLISIPSTATAQTETIRVIDSSGGSGSITLKVRAFQTVNSYSYATSPAYTYFHATAIDSANGSYFAAGEMADMGGSSHWVVYKSTNGGSTWTAQDDFTYANFYSASAKRILIDGSSNIFVAGLALDSDSMAHWIVRKSADGGASWSTIDDFNYGGYLGGSPAAITIDGTNNIYLVGEARDGSWQSHWVVRRGAGGGASWSTVDDYSLVSGNDSTAYGVAVQAGNVFVAGYANDAGNVSKWIVRKSSDQGATWSVVDTFALQATQPSIPAAMVFDATGGLFIAGQGVDISGHTHWLVRQSTNSGASWTTVDDYAGVGGSNVASARAIAADGSGHLVVVGTDQNAPWNHWVARISADSGASWTSTDDYTHPSVAESVPDDVAIAPSGAVAVAGIGTYQGVIRVSSNRGAAWSTGLSLAPIIDLPASPLGLARDSTGLLWSVGAASENSNSHWLIRKSSDQGATWTLMDDVVSTGGSGDARSIVVDGDGAIYAAGVLTTINGTNLSVRKSSNGGASWTTVDEFINPSFWLSSATSIATNGNGTLFVVGSALDSTPVGHWIVRRSTDHGATWSVVDDFQQVITDYTGAVAAAWDPTSNTIYVGGIGNDQMIVRKSTDGGTTWTTANVFAYTVGLPSVLSNLAVDSAGKIYVSGYADDNSGGRHWLVRKSVDGGTTWSTVDDFLPANTQYGIAGPIAIDSDDHVFVLGNSGSNISDLITRKSADGGATWVTIDSYSGTQINNLPTMGSGIVTCGISQLCILAYNGGHWISRTLSP